MLNVTKIKMKINNKNYKTGTTKPNKRRRLIYLLLVLAIAVLVGLFYMFYINKTDDTVDPNSTDPTIETTKTKSKNSELPLDSDDIPRDATSDQIPSNPQLSVSISNFSQANGEVKAEALINGSSGDGTCVFNFSTPEGKPVVKELASSTTGNEQLCSLTLTEVEFDKIGTWELTVTFYKDGAKSVASKNVEVR